jgi:hypothetical protein
MALTLGAGLVGLPLLWRDAGPTEEFAESAHRLDLSAPASVVISRTPQTMFDPRPMAGGDMSRFAEGASAPQAEAAVQPSAAPRVAPEAKPASLTPAAPQIASVETNRPAPMPPRRPAELALAAPSAEPSARPRLEPAKPAASAKGAAAASANDAESRQEAVQSAGASPDPRRQGRARRDVASRTAPKATEAPSFFERLFGGLNQRPGGSVMAYAPVGGAMDDRAQFAAAGATTLSRQAALPRQAPSLDLTPRAAPSLGGGRAIYDISAQMVYLPDGTRLEAHSGLGEHRDSVASRHIRMRGVTPPHVYNLTEREALFHGVRAIRLNPVGGSGAIFGRAGLLAHTYMLGPNGDSNGCVSIRDYNAFLRAYLSGQIRQLVVVDSMRNLPSQFAQR